MLILFIIEIRNVSPYNEYVNKLYCRISSFLLKSICCYSHIDIWTIGCIVA